ncbi:MAG: hypothetical protein SVM86_06330, partial [Candidatus Cloacimonadota bacterium]|nr:hypothetical protein [Candidatus Cloacimonadota bacterium]
EGKQKAKIIRARWEISQDKPLKTNLEELIKSENKEVRAHAQYLKGFSLYKQKKYQDAVPELLRVRYLFPEMKQVRIDAEILACRAYIELGNMKDARQTYEMIENDLDSTTKEELIKALNEGGK